jgi:hypothetical protein
MTSIFSIPRDSGTHISPGELAKRIETQKTRIKRAHITLMKCPQTALYGGVMLMGTTDVVVADITAYTDGVNKRYGVFFIEPLTDEELRGLILHENLHVALKQIPRGRDMWKKDAELANMAADFVVNDIIMNITGKTSSGEAIVKLPAGGLFDPMFHNWSHRQVFDYLYEECEGGKKPPEDGDPCDDGDEGNGPSGGGTPSKKPRKVKVNGKDYSTDDTLDEHDTSGVDGLDGQELKDVNDKVDRALREGGLLAGRLGAKVPRVIADLLEPKIDWREVLREFVSASIKGADELTWRKMNRRQLANDLYLPSIENETIGEVIIAIDTSGSIGQRELSEFATELKAVCDATSPDRVRVLWWDTRVHGEQVFEKDYSNIEKLLKPLGGGGTHVSSVSKYIVEKKLEAECVIVFTDGYVENDIQWAVTSPTLWMITHNKGFVPPVGKSVFFDREV